MLQTVLLSKFLFASFFFCSTDLLRFLLSSLLASLINICFYFFVFHINLAIALNSIKPYEAGHCEKLCKAVKFVFLLLPIFQIRVDH